MSNVTDAPWPALIGEMILVKHELAKVDGGLWPHHLPGIGADATRIAQAETALGIALPTSFRAFLRHANGWRAVLHRIDLLSCDQLVQGQHRDYFHRLYSVADLDVLGAAGLRPESTLPIGVSLVEKDAFILDLASPGATDSRVLWLAGAVIDEWATFGGFFKSLIEYNRLELLHFLGKRPGGVQ